MKKAILKTLIYANIFDYPLKINEIHKWLIGRKVTLRQVERALEELVQSAMGNPSTSLRVKVQGGYYFLPRKAGMVTRRRRREKQSAAYLRKVKLLSQILKVIPWIKLVGISGGLALHNAFQKDDIDLFIITAKNRLWVSRLLSLGLLSVIGQRRKVGEKGRKIAGKLCINILLEEDRLEQRSKDIFVAHEVLQMKVLWQRDGVYSKYLEDNSWALGFLPNWVATHDRDLRFTSNDLLIKNHKSIFDCIETLAKKFQLWYMQKPKGMERIEDGALYFHPEDCRGQILAEYQARLKNV